jgi:hypothetical protein
MSEGSLGLAASIADLAEGEMEPGTLDVMEALALQQGFQGRRLGVR